MFSFLVLLQKLFLFAALLPSVVAMLFPHLTILGCPLVGTELYFGFIHTMELGESKESCSILHGN
jgi:hypothetical protein